MTLEQAQRICGNQSDTAINSMRIALQMHPWHNTADDWQRLEAAKVVLRHRRAKARDIRRNTHRGDM